MIARNAVAISGRRIAPCGPSQRIKPSSTQHRVTTTIIAAMLINTHKPTSPAGMKWASNAPNAPPIVPSGQGDLNLGVAALTAFIERFPTHPAAAQAREALVAHYRAVADAARIPIMIYNWPEVTGVDIPSEAVAELSEHPNIVGIKESSGSIARASEASNWFCSTTVAPWVIVVSNPFMHA